MDSTEFFKKKGIGQIFKTPKVVIKYKCFVTNSLYELNFGANSKISKKLILDYP
jgi:hypothetical protein